MRGTPSGLALVRVRVRVRVRARVRVRVRVRPSGLALRADAPVGQVHVEHDG